MTRATARPNAFGRRLQVSSLIASLCLLVAIATVFILFLIRVQGGAGAYMAGQSHWSRAQLGAVFALYRYNESGDPDELTLARQLLDIPLGDMEARRAMEGDSLDRSTARDGLLRGGNHPDDIPSMIWMYRYFSDFPYFRDTVKVWRESDAYLLALAELANDMEVAWADGRISEEEQEQLLARLVDANEALYALSMSFIGELSYGTRQLRWALMFVGVIMICLLTLLAVLLAWRLTRLVSRSRRRFQSIFEQAAVGMAEMDVNGRFINVNAALCEILDYKREDLIGRFYNTLTYPEDADIGLEQGQKLLRTRQDAVTVEQRFRRKDGVLVWGRITVSVVSADGNEADTLIAIIEDVSESRRLSIELEHQAAHDSLTGLLNRRSFERSLARALRMVREQKVPHAVCFIDMDRFKVVNDTCGHVAGDHLLVQVSDLLHAQLREGDVLARLGGDEFGLLLKDCSLDDAGRVATKLGDAMEGFHFEWEGKPFNISCSIGVVPIEAEMSNVDSVLRAADLACYVAKEQGRNRVHVSSSEGEQVARQRGEMEWLNRIRQALDEDRFYLDAQCIKPLLADEALRYEVLVRMLDEEGKTVPPGFFIPAAERFGAAYRLDRWVIEQVCRVLADRPDHLKSLGACHVNLSGQSFDRPEFQAFVLDTLKYHGIPPARICFEITETAAIRHLDDAIAFMGHLGSKGCEFALDDFGAGLSSFGYLRHLPVQYLKIDGSFVRNMLDDKADLAMVKAIKEIGQTMDKRIIAEFVETEKLARRLREMGVDYGQGFGIHRPERWEELFRRDP